MKTQGTFRKLAIFMTVLAAFVALTATASTARNNEKVFWVDLAAQGKQHPDFVYFVANAGGQVRNITWKHWGDHKAVGRGRYVDTSARYPGKLNQNGPAKLIARKPIRCTPRFGDFKGTTIRVYRHVKLIYPNGKGGKSTANVSATAGYLTCKETR